MMLSISSFFSWLLLSCEMFLLLSQLCIDNCNFAIKEASVNNAGVCTWFYYTVQGILVILKFRAIGNVYHKFNHWVSWWYKAVESIWFYYVLFLSHKLFYQIILRCVIQLFLEILRQKEFNSGCEMTSCTDYIFTGIFLVDSELSS